MIDAERVRDLLRTPASIQVALHNATQLAVHLQAAWLRARPAGQHLRVCNVRAILAPIDSGVALSFSRNSRHRPPELLSDRGRGPTSAHSVRDDDPLLL